MATSMIYNNFIPIFHIAHMKNLPELGQAQNFNPANDCDALDLSIVIYRCKTSKQTNTKVQPGAEFAMPHASYGAISCLEEFAD